MIPYWLQLVASCGLTSIIIYGSILKLPREYLKRNFKILDTFLTCSMCVGFWVGIFSSVITNRNCIEIITLGFATSSVCWLYDSLVGSLQAREVFLTKKIKTK